MVLSKFAFLNVAVQRKEKKKTSKEPQVLVEFARPDFVVGVPEYQLYFM